MTKIATPYSERAAHAVAGEGTTRDFRAELELRLTRATAIMQVNDVQGLLIYSDAGNAGNVRYLTNYRPFFGCALLVLRQDGEQILVNSFDWDAPRARLASGVERVYSGFDSGDLVQKALSDLGLAGGAQLGLIGANLIPFELYSTVFDHETRRPVNLHREYEELRLIKSAFEQEMLRGAASITDAAIGAVQAEMRAGTSEQELAASVEHHMKQAGADGLAFPASVASGPNTEKPVSLPTSRLLEPGDLVMVDVGATWEGYSADITRTFVVGSPSERQSEIFNAVAGALRAATSAVRPGLPANELHRIAVENLATYGLAQYFTHRVGHGIGLETSLEAPDLRRDSAALRPGMTFCIEPGVYIPEVGGIKIKDNVIVGMDGPEVISHASRDLVSV